MESTGSKHCAKCSTTKSGLDFGQNRARKDGLQTYCKACSKNYFAHKQYDKKRWAEKKDVESERNRQYRASVADKLKPADRARASRRRAENPGLVRAFNIARKHGQKKATPQWADFRRMNSIYAEAKRLQQTDGVKRHVDHVIPLKHKLVCGLHVPENLKILTDVENMAKHNRFECHVGP